MAKIGKIAVKKKRKKTKKSIKKRKKLKNKTTRKLSKSEKKLKNLKPKTNGGKMSAELKLSSVLDTSHLKVKFPFKAKYGNYINGKFVEPKSGKYRCNCADRRCAAVTAIRHPARARSQLIRLTMGWHVQWSQWRCKSAGCKSAALRLGEAQE